MTASKAYKDFGFGAPAKNPFLFMFGSVDSFLKSNNQLFEKLNHLPLYTYINIRIESIDKSTLEFIGKPLGESKVREAFEKIFDDSSELHSTFIRAMHSLGMLGEADALINCVDLSGCQNMIDAGGGSGIYSIFLCQKYPDLKSIILDSHDTLAVTKEFIAKHNESKRIELRECDITKDKLGDNIDAVLLSVIAG